MKTYVSVNDDKIVDGWQAGYTDDDNGPLRSIEVDSEETAIAVQGTRLVEGNNTPANINDFELVPEPEPTEINIPVRDYISNLIGDSVYAGLLLMMDGLRVKWDRNECTPDEVTYYGQLMAADRLMQMGGTINLLDPRVSGMLDLAVANPHIAFTAEDKARVLRNEVI